MPKERLFFISCVILLVVAVMVAGVVILYNGRQGAPVAAAPVQSLSSFNLDQAQSPSYAAGVVTAVGSDALTVKLRQLVGQVTDQGTHTFAVDSRTEIYAIGKAKDVATFEKQQLAFRAVQAATTTPLFGVDPFEHVPLTLAGLHVGDTVAIALAPGQRSVPLAMRVELVATATSTAPTTAHL